MERVAVAVVYNPYILHLLYVKMRYLRRIIARYYKHHSGTEEDAARLIDYCVLNDWYAEIVTRDVELLQEHMQKEAFPMPLCYCHYEYYVFRLSQVLRAPGDPIDTLYGGRRYECEVNALMVMEQDHHRLQLQSLLRNYIEQFYFQRDAMPHTKHRVQLLFHVKQTLEKEIRESVIDKENMLFFVQYDNELITTLFYIHLVEELLCLHEKQLSLTDHATFVPQFTFVKRKLFFSKESVGKTRHDEQQQPCTDSFVGLMLNKFMMNLCDTFWRQIPDRTRYYPKSTTTPEEESPSNTWFSLNILSSPPLSTDTENKLTKQALLLNREYLLTRPLDETVTLSMVGSKRVIGRSDFYGKNKNTTPAVPIVYMNFKENRVHYVHFLYRIVFEMFLREQHTCVNNKSCYLCAYYTRCESNRRLASFFMTCDEQIEDPEALSGRIHNVNSELEKLYIERVPSLTLCSYKILANVFFLFQSMINSKETQESLSLLSIINPVELLNTLSKTVILCKLEAKMCEVIKLCHLKLNIHPEEEHNIIIEREQALAMDIELVRLINDAIIAQQNEIKRYERSVSTNIITIDSLEISRVLRKIYVSHIDILCQLIVERRETVLFDT